ncbi:hypothetical protein QTH30_03485 [Clostridium perfringens]|nr:hypothetical protein [Clostridium perfringens]MDK0661550.1 hypothetical protein [Clostridium perfringens]MDM0514978.1 hypothetical protein [Clostridium perfringens]MDM0517856.1 hypothetical protein [Clostridium perfringens]MDM0520545.1 hypothetical protein [Clostridium perfringens]MDM0638140.1 hypothetical protein [Clostridium perfringens]
MNPKEILDTLDYLNINEIEMANVELGEMGKERIRKKIKNAIKNSRNKKN